MRYVDGRDLRHRLERGRLDPAEAIGIVAQVASALDVAHARGLVHRDVKPSNVLLDTGARPDGSDHAYLADFGLTKRLAEPSRLTEDGTLLGTIDYVAPEQIAGEEVDGRADVYSLGCVLYECLAGAPPFRRDSELAAVFAHLDADPPALSAERPDVPAGLDAVVATALAKEPKRRYELPRARAGGARRDRRRGEPRAGGRRVPRGRRPDRAERCRGRAGRQGGRPPARARAGSRPRRPAHFGPSGRRRRLPVQGPGEFRARGRRLLLWSRAPDR